MRSSKKVVVLSGAGMSAESGLGTFRDNGGLWERFAIDEVATPKAWEKDPERVTDFYNMRRKQCYEAYPNQGHKVLARLENYFDVQIVTQNIDDLHERAGSTNVLHLHGEINKVKTSGPNTEKAYFLQESWEVKMGDKCPDGYQLRPHVVWFGEAVPMMGEAIKVVEKADIFVVVGTSLNVYPAAGLVNYVPNAAQKFLIDPKEVSVSNNFSIISKSASDGLKDLYEILF
jgi:NAD-dependent deacetylase